MSARTGRVLLPDPIPVKSMISLAKLRLKLCCPKKTPVDLQPLCKALLATSAPRVAAMANLAGDPFAGCVLMLAATDDLTLYVAAHPQDVCYQINPQAIREESAGFLVDQTVAHGIFVVVPRLMYDGSIEVQLDGQAIFVSKGQAESALKQKSTSPRTLDKVVREVIDAAKSENVELSNKQIIERVRKHPAVNSVSERRIKAVAKIYKPKNWSTPGPKSERRSSG